MMTGVFSFVMDRFKFKKGFRNMKTFTKLMAATAVALTMGATAANAAVHVSIDGMNDLAGPLSIDMLGDFAYGFGAMGGFTNVGVSGNVGVFPEVLSTQSAFADTSGPTNGSATIWVTQTFLSNPSASFLSSYAFNTPRGWSGSIKTFVSTSNALFTGTAAGAGIFGTCAAANCSQQDQFQTAQIGVGGNPYSVTHVYTFKAATAPGTGRANAITTVVPEPGTWALMIMGFGGAGAMLRSRRRSLAAAA